MARKLTDPKKSLIEALKIAKKVAPTGILKTTLLAPSKRTKLQQSGWLYEICKGWCCLISPDGAIGTSEIWYSNFWIFVKCYLKDRFNTRQYCLSAESSLEVHIESPTIPSQVVVNTKGKSWQILKLPETTSILIQPDRHSFPKEIVNVNGINVMLIYMALAKLSPSFFKHRASDVQIALSLIKDVSALSRALLSTESKITAERLAGVYEFMGETAKAREIVENFKMAGFNITAKNPFTTESMKLNLRGSIFDPNKARLKALWHIMRKDIAAIKPNFPKNGSIETILKNINNEVYKKDAYNSLSIEGYQVSIELIEKIAAGHWNPETSQGDKKQKDALAAKGYRNCFLLVMQAIKQIINEKKDSVATIEHSYHYWYRALFSPSIQAGVLNSCDLIGFRNISVYIRGSRHVPPRYEAIIGCMETFFELLHEEPEPFVRAVLGHFFFVYIHPFVDGNGRLARFILNVFLVVNGFEWTVIKAEHRDSYLSALEEASTKQNIVPFTKFVIGEMV